MIHDRQRRSRRHWLVCAALGGASALLASLPGAIAHAQPYPPGAARERGVESVEVFYDALAPDGDWIWQEPYGWVWSPDRVSIGWRPYSSDGRWVYTDDGWFWESELPWGWATFHYGRWYHSPEEGWLWVPGSEWAPAWVEWRRGAGYFGWAPLPPRARFDSRRGIAWQGDREIREPQAWSFVPERELLEPRLSVHIEYEPRNVTLLARTRPTPDNYSVVDRRIINRGPDVVEVERVIGHPVRPLRFEEVPSYRDSRQQGETLRVYRPQLRPMSARPRRDAMHARPGATLSREELEQRRRERAEQIDRYEAEQRRALAERQAREEREARADERAEVARRHEQERREEAAEVARHRRAAQAAEARRRRAEAPPPAKPTEKRRRSEGRP